MTRERTSFTLDLRDILFSFQMLFIFVKTAMAWAIHERTSSLNPSAETFLQVSEACPGIQLLSFHLDLPLDVISAVCHHFGYLSININ